jgi:hypothetical protein
MRTVRKSHQPKASKSCCSPIVAVACIILVTWSLFLTYAFRKNIIERVGDSAELERLTSALRDKLEKNLRHARDVAATYQNKPPVGDHKTKEESNKAAIGRSSTKDEAHNFHVIFSTDCSFFQDWQTILVFHSAKVVHQEGDITRIASGCDDQQKETLRALYVELFPDHHYHVHFTPDFKKDPKTQESYDFYNKPFGVHHWLKYADPPIKDGTVIALIDPDFIFLRPMSAKVTGRPNIYMAGPTRFVTSEADMPEPVQEYVEKGKPAAQLYGLGAPWAQARPKHFNITSICGPNSPCHEVSVQFGEVHYR